MVEASEASLLSLLSVLLLVTTAAVEFSNSMVISLSAISMLMPAGESTTSIAADAISKSFSSASLAGVSTWSTGGTTDCDPLTADALAPDEEFR
jgi:hypothetical protein